MAGEDFDASTAGRRVGYEDASHFNREYKRLFSEPPVRDAQRFREITKVVATICRLRWLSGLAEGTAPVTGPQSYRPQSRTRLLLAAGVRGGLRGGVLFCPELLWLRMVDERRQWLIGRRRICWTGRSVSPSADCRRRFNHAIAGGLAGLSAVCQIRYRALRGRVRQPLCRRRRVAHPPIPRRTSFRHSRKRVRRRRDRRWRA